MNCPPGTTNAAGDLATGGDTNCEIIVCGINQHVAGNKCMNCTANATRAAGDEATGNDTACACGANTHVLSNACVDCAPGSTRPAGDFPVAHMCRYGRRSGVAI